MAGANRPTFLEEWCKENNVPVHEGRERYMAFVILACISANTNLSSCLVFKGGNALRFVHQSPRSTKDLDFTVKSDILADDEEKIRSVMDIALKWGFQRYQVKAKCQRVKRNPSRRDATRPTYDVKIGYLYPDDRYFNDFENRNVATVIPVEISFNDLVCEDEPYTPDNQHAFAVRVCTLEDITAEKLRSLLQQPKRNRNRCQDVFDLARIYKESLNQLDLTKVAKFFREKCQIREVEPKRCAFNDEVREMAEVDYETRIKSQAPKDFIPFDEAWNSTIHLVDRLNL